jgi:hypothetical protein
MVFGTGETNLYLPVKLIRILCIIGYELWIMGFYQDLIHTNKAHNP